jgi:radical SAM protein with 4Fe4S-binding SPASM domain
MIPAKGDNSAPADGSAAPACDPPTAAAVGRYRTASFAPSDNENQSPCRADDGHVSSGRYAADASSLVDVITPEALQIRYHHPLENWLGRRPVRWLLAKLTADSPGGQTALERILASYRDEAASGWRRLTYWPVHRLIDRLRGATDVATFRRRVAQHKPTLHGLVIVARSIAEFGLTRPQRFVAPLFAVWNFTNRCNLACRHCYQDSRKSPLAHELTLDEKLDLVGQMGRAHMPMLAFSGGEPTLSADLVPVIRRAASHGMHLTIATNGTTMTAQRAAELAEAGLRYVEISLDSVAPARHDAFRGCPGMWEKAVRGAKAVVATPGLRLGIAMCVHQGNFHEAPAMLRFAEELGAGCFAHFNFIPVGRGLRMVEGDITPAQREELLRLLNQKMQAGGMGVISTAPQLGRVCLAGSPADGGRTACSHAGSGSGAKARVVAKYLGGCGAGRTYICIEPAGDVTPCVYMPHRVMGNVRQRPLLDIFRDNTLWDILNDRRRRLHHCGVCVFRDYCGGCRARADAYFGQLHAGDPGCLFNEKHWEKLVSEGVAVVKEGKDASQVKLTPTRHGLG